MVTADHLLTLFGPFCDARNISESRLSMLLFNDGKRIGLLRRGGDIGSRRLLDAFQWLSNHWPEGAHWPDDVPRPAPSEKAAA
jgi:hypothetical protein